MNDIPEMTRLLAKKKQLKLLMIIMLVFMAAAPLLGPIIFVDEFRHMNDTGRKFYYVATPTVFGFIFVFYLVLYRRIERKIRERK